MRTFTLIALAMLAACATEAPPTIQVDVYVPDDAPPTIVVEVPETEEAGQEECVGSILLRAYTDDGHYVDVPVGTLPTVTMTTQAPIRNGGGFTTSFAIHNLNGCGFDLVGIQAIIERADGVPFTYGRHFQANALLSDLSSGEVVQGPVSWAGNTLYETVAESISFTFDAEYGPRGDIGDFTPQTIESLGVREYNLTFVNDVALLPGEYMITHVIKWVDHKTGTEVWYYNVDGNGSVQYITIN